MNDDDLRAGLSRRASKSMTDDERNNVIRAARLQALQPRRRSVVPRLAGWVAGTAAAIVLILVALPILLSPPGARQSPTAVVDGSRQPSRCPAA